MTSKGLVRDLG